MRFATPQGFNSGDQFFAYLKDSFDTLYAEGRRAAAHDEHRPALPPGRPAGPRRGAEALHRLRQGARQGLAGAAHRHRQALAREPSVPAPALRPSRMERGRFRRSASAASSNIRHGSPRRAYELELGPAHDSAGGLHNALCRVFRAASEAERLAVLNAHPDLAGKLAAARRLTAESTRRAGSAGLDALTDAERERFSELNAAYVDQIRLSLHHRGARARPRRTSWRPSKRASATTARPNSTPPANRWSALRCCASRTCCRHSRQGSGDMEWPAPIYYAPPAATRRRASC